MNQTPSQTPEQQRAAWEKKKALAIEITGQVVREQEAVRSGEAGVCSACGACVPASKFDRRDKVCLRCKERGR
jgi:hypothetical protein